MKASRGFRQFNPCFVQALGSRIQIFWDFRVSDLGFKVQGLWGRISLSTHE